MEGEWFEPSRVYIAIRAFCECSISKLYSANLCHHSILSLSINYNNLNRETKKTALYLFCKGVSFN